MYDVNEQNELRELKNMEIVDGFLNKNVTPTESDMINWDLEMIAYYKQKIELLVDKWEINKEEDVLEEVNGIAKNMKGNDVKGMDDGVLGECRFSKIYLMDFKIGTYNIIGLSSSDKQKEVMNCIREDNLQVCAILETHLNSKKVDKVCERIYGRWNWISNVRYCNKGCIIMIGWNEGEVSIFVIHMARQYVLLKMETINNIKMYGTFIYVANGGIERKELWRDLEIYRRIVRKDSWFLSGDMNVTLAPNEQSAGGSNVSSDMKDFKCCVNKIEMEDINSSCFFFTWTKNLHKVKKGD
ncbi:RNA-directed DNA polymerase, eukaryota, reverse transcriptase zinc-binding domain protein [Tanacetum coccineum]